MGQIALAEDDKAQARQLFDKALGLYSRIPEPYSMGLCHRWFARLARARSQQRRQHVLAARELWSSIDRQDLVKALDNEFGPP